MNFAAVGGGVAGLSAAIALQQAGHTVTVYERASAVRSLGAGIVSWPNASFVLEALGVWPQLRARATPVHSMQRLTDSGELLGSIDVRQIDAALGHPSLAVLRHDLMDALRDRALALGVQLRYGQRLRALEAVAPEGPGATRLVFEGGETLQPDWILGTEGRMQSPSRAFVLGAEQAQPQYQGFVNWIGVCETPQPVFTPGTVLDYWGQGERFGVVALSAQRAYWAGGAALPLGVAEPARYRADLQARFGHWPAPVQAALQSTPGSGIHQIYLHDHAPSGPWQRANVLLLGDAAHAPLPTSGQGACQALEDAWHLARCVEQHGRDVPAAWAQFVLQRQPKAYGIVQAGRQLAQGIFHTPAQGVARRNEAARAADYAALARGMAQAWAQGLPLRHH